VQNQILFAFRAGAVGAVQPAVRIGRREAKPPEPVPAAAGAGANVRKKRAAMRFSDVRIPAAVFLNRPNGGIRNNFPKFAG